MNKTDPYFKNMWISMTILDSNGITMFTNSTLVVTGTAAFAYAIPDTIPGGLYTVRVSNYNIGTVSKQLRIRDYPRNKLVVTTTLTQDSYRPGDII